MAGSRERMPSGAITLLLLTVLIATAGVVLTVLAWGDLAPRDAYPNLVSGIASIFYAALGGLILRRERNVIGWILQAVGLGLAILCFGSAYAVFGIATHPGLLPAPRIVGGVAGWIFGPTVTALAFMLFLFPSGTLPSPRWRPIFIVGLVASALTTILVVIQPRPIGVPAPGGALRFDNPLGIRSLGGVISTLLVGTAWVVILVVVAAFVSLIVRFRKGDRDLRQQIKWVAFAAALAFAFLIAGVGSLVGCHCNSSSLATLFLLANALVTLIGVPAALTIAILRYRLYDIDLIISRTLVYTLLAAILTAIYVAVVVGVGTVLGSRGSSLLTIAAAVAIAISFQPLRHRAQRFANRLVYGDRATPYQVLSDFAEDMAGAYGLDDVLQRMASILAQGTGATRVDVWLRLGGELRPAATWPDEAATPDPLPLGADGGLPDFAGITRAVPVRHGDDVLGALTLEKPRNEPLSPTEDKLLQDLASQAGLVLRNSRLTAELQASVRELRASRRRLVEAQDEERRKIERNLHDGAQQQLVALSVQLGLLERVAGDADRVRQMTGQLQGGLQGALEDLRDLARGIYPPLLADKGLAAALEAQGRKAAVPMTVEPDGVGRYPREVEAAVYFCALEAVQNVAKYAAADAAVIRLSERDGTLSFEIQDDGRGFDPGSTTHGSGLQGMADRLDAIGGTFDIESAPGHGTLVRGQITLR